MGDIIRNAGYNREWNHSAKQISKTGFLKNLQCELAGYLHVRRGNLEKPFSPNSAALLAMGQEIGKKAWELHPGGVDASKGGQLTRREHIEYTQKLIKDSCPIIYEAAFESQSDGGLCFCVTDIFLTHTAHVIEVKSSTKLEDIHIWDCSFQYRILCDAKLYVKKLSVAFINNEYEYLGGAVNVEQLFRLENITRRVKAAQYLVRRRLNVFKKNLALPSAPKADIGTHCFKPYECAFRALCWKHIPEKGTVFNIRGLRLEKKFDLYYRGYLSIGNVPVELLNEKQQIQAIVHRDMENHIDLPKLKEFLSTLDEPLYFWDIESTNPGIPLYPNSRPYEQIPFQYSLHKLENGVLTHREFLADYDGTDPRAEFVRRFLEDTEQPGRIIVYSHFEATRLKRLINLFPEMEKELCDRYSRLKDISEPFANCDIYHRDFNGKFSIKAVLPAFVPELSYADLKINNGADAAQAFLKMAKLQTREKNDIRTALLKYCERDTLCMVRLYEYLKITAAQPPKMNRKPKRK